MRNLIKSLLSQSKRLYHDLHPGAVQAMFNGEEHPGVISYAYEERWEMLEVGYEHGRDLTLRIQLALWPVPPDVGEEVFINGASYKVGGRDHTADGSEMKLLLMLGQ